MAKATTPASVGFAHVNLMPRSEIEKRERERLTRAWVWGVFGAIVLTLLIIAGAFWLNLMAAQRLASEQAKTNDLLLQLSSLSEVSGALATEAELEDFRSLAMSTDLSWTPVIAAVASVLPADSVMTGFELTTGGAPQTDDPSGEAGLSGIVSVESPRPLDIVDIARALRGVDGVLYADGQSVLSSASTGGRFAYILNVTFDQTVYADAYPATEEGDN